MVHRVSDFGVFSFADLHRDLICARVGKNNLPELFRVLRVLGTSFEYGEYLLH